MENSSTSKHLQLSPGRWPNTKAFPLLYSVLTAIGVAAVWIIALLLVFFGAQKCGLNIVHVDMNHPTPAQTTIFFLLQDASYIPPTIFLLVLVPRLAKCSLRELGMGVPKWRDLFNGFIGAIIATIAVTIASMLFEALTRQEHHQNELALFHHLNTTQTWVAVITAVILAPLFEELLFRFFLFNALSRYMPISIAVFVSGTIFGLAHGQLDIAPSLAVCGMVLAAIYYRTGSFWSNAIAHGCFNGFTTMALLVFHVGG